MLQLPVAPDGSIDPDAPIPDTFIYLCAAGSSQVRIMGEGPWMKHNGFHLLFSATHPRLSTAAQARPSASHASPRAPSLAALAAPRSGSLSAKTVRGVLTKTRSHSRLLPRHSNRAPSRHETLSRASSLHGSLTRCALILAHHSHYRLLLPHLASRCSCNKRAQRRRVRRLAAAADRAAARPAESRHDCRSRCHRARCAPQGVRRLCRGPAAGQRGQL